jgi:hypothetical protein
MDFSFQPAQRLKGFDQPRVWSVLTPLAQKLNAANLVRLYLLYRGKGFQHGPHQTSF